MVQTSSIERVLNVVRSGVFLVAVLLGIFVMWKSFEFALYSGAERGLALQVIGLGLAFGTYLITVPLFSWLGVFDDDHNRPYAVSLSDEAGEDAAKDHSDVADIEADATSDTDGDDSVDEGGDTNSNVYLTLLRDPEILLVLVVLLVTFTGIALMVVGHYI